MLLYSVLLLTAISIAADIDLPSSCIGLEDGVYWMKLLDDDTLPILQVQCSNEYMIIDASNDANWRAYFSTWSDYHYAVVGPERNDLVNWHQWFLPSSIVSPNDAQFVVSLDCSSCDEQHYAQRHDTHSAFYLSALAFGCFNPTRGWPSCDFSYESYECRVCQWNEEQSQIEWMPRDYEALEEANVDAQSLLTGVCDFEIRTSFDTVLQSYQECTNYAPDNYHNFKPSLGTNGQHCQCYKPMGVDKNTIRVTQQAYDLALVNAEQKMAEDDTVVVVETSDTHVVHLSQGDFDKGTYRIERPGTYIIDEDIVFDFNAPQNEDDIFADDAWWPNAADIDEYPGAQQSRDAYFLGFFAGIVIEADDVVLDLNQHSLRMSEQFYFTQPFFSIIELASQPFLPQQGPGFFGSSPVFATNVCIKNGVLGLSSHHGIHGNYNEHVRVEGVHIRDFTTHGVQLNGFRDVVLQDVEVGPSTTMAYLNGNFGQLRALLPTLRRIAAQHPTDSITFHGREATPYTMHDLLHRLLPVMRNAFDWAYFKSQHNNAAALAIETDTSIEFESVRKFLNPSGLSYGAVTYGVFLNYPSAGIFGWHVNDEQSDGAVLDNVYIHDIQRSGDEVIGLAQRGRAYCNAFNGPLPLVSMFGGMEEVRQFADALLTSDDEEQDVIYAQYVGDIVTDVHIAMYEFGRDDFDNWPGIPFFGEHEGLLAWAKGEDATYVSSDSDLLEVYCNNDAMFHPSKGNLGVKISGVKNVQLNAVRIENLVDLTKLGHDLCGSRDLYHFSQQSPYQLGFSMNMVHAMAIDFSEVSITQPLHINGVYSKTGLAFAMSTWFDTQITYQAAVHISNVYAGFGIDESAVQLSYDDRPNKAPEACAVRIYSSDSYQVKNVFDAQHDIDMDSIRIQCIHGSVGCFGDTDGKYSDLGNVIAEHNNEATCQVVPKMSSHGTMPHLSADKNAYASFDSHPLFFAMIAVALVVCLCAVKLVYRDYALKKVVSSNFKYELTNTEEDDAEAYGTF